MEEEILYDTYIYKYMHVMYTYQKVLFHILQCNYSKIDLKSHPHSMRVLQKKGKTCFRSWFAGSVHETAFINATNS